MRWATPQLLSVLNRAARTVARKFPGSVLQIGELSRRDGGRIPSHLSHQNGRDADVSFYYVDTAGDPVKVPKFLRSDGHGEGRDDPTVRFDEKRNWAFVRALLEDTEVEVRQIFIYAPLRARLLAYAAKVRAPLALRAKAAAAMMQPINALPHDDHFHIRISCPADQLEFGCSDLPMWRAPGSPDEFGPELLAEAPRPDGLTPAFPLEAWGPLSRLWSSERGVCHRVDATCSALGEGPVCEDLSVLRGPATAPMSPPPPDEMGTPGEPIMSSVDLEIASAEGGYCGPAAEPIAPQCTMPASALVARSAVPASAAPAGPPVTQPQEPLFLSLEPATNLALTSSDRCALPASLLASTLDAAPNACEHERSMAVLSSERPLDRSSEISAGLSALQ